MTIDSIFRALSDGSHLAAYVLLLVKLHASRSAAGVSLKTQKLYLLVFLARYSRLAFYVISWYNTATNVTKIGLTMTTIGMMKYRPSLRASYDVSLDHFRMWMHGIIPSFILAVVIFLQRDYVLNFFFESYMFLWTFSEVLEPVALVPQLLVLRGCPDAGRLAWVYVSLLVAYRGFLGLEFIHLAYTEPRYRHHPTLYVATAVHMGMYVAFLVDRKCRSIHRSPTGQTGDTIEPYSAAREPLLPEQKGADHYSGDDKSGSVEASVGGGATGSEIRPSHGQRRRGEVEDRIKGVLMKERGHSSSAPGSGGGGGGTAGDTGSEGGMGGGSGGAYFV